MYVLRHGDLRRPGGRGRDRWRTCCRLTGPPVGKIVGVVLLAGFLATTAVELRRATSARDVTYRFGLDPDNFGIPLVVVGLGPARRASSLILSLVILGLT